VLWLLVALVPGLLILATLWLGRLERDLAHDSVTASDVAEFLRHADAADVHMLARAGLSDALDSQQRRHARRLSESPRLRAIEAPRPPSPYLAASLRERAEYTLPTHVPMAVHRHRRANPQVTGTRHVNHV
jgi:hypothetical protein